MYADVRAAVAQVRLIDHQTPADLDLHLVVDNLPLTRPLP
jgi:hypothetical protein